MTLWIFISIVACKKEENSKAIYTIKGKVYENCTKIPFAYRQLQLVHFTNTGDCHQDAPVTTTDAFGRFFFTYSETCDNQSFTDEYQIIIASGADKGRVLISRIPGKMDLTLGDLFADNKISIFIDIYTDREHESTDTLYFGINAADYYTLNPIHPVQDVYSFNANEQLYTNMNRFNTNTFFYAIGYEAYKQGFQSTAAAKSEVLSNADCSTSKLVDTIRVSLL